MNDPDDVVKPRTQVVAISLNTARLIRRRYNGFMCAVVGHDANGQEQVTLSKMHWTAINPNSEKPI